MSIRFYSVFLFYLFISAYSLFVFTNIPIVSRLISVILFGLLFVLTSALLIDREGCSLKPEVNPSKIACGFIVFLFLFFVLFNPSDTFLAYFRAFPLLEADFGLGWHHDSAFHVSIIQSIINFGYPSTGQHGVPFITYHVLSHYVDALFLVLSGSDPWESYGFYYFLKSSLFVCASTIFIISLTRRWSTFLYIASVCILLPILVGTWHAVGSHGLWFTSLILLSTSKYVYKIVFSEELVSWSSLLFITFILVLISIGKVSSGFMYSSLIGFILLLKNPRDLKIFLWGGGLLVFFYFYNQLYAGSQSSTPAFQLEGAYRFLLLKTDVLNNQMIQIYYILLSVALAGFVLRFKALNVLFYASFCSVVALSLIVSPSDLFSKSDIWYFCYGLNFPMFLFALQAFLGGWEGYLKNQQLSIRVFKPKKVVAVIVVVFLTLSQLNQATFSIFLFRVNSIGWALSNFTKQHYMTLNKMSEDNVYTIFERPDTQRLKEDFAEESRFILHNLKKTTEDLLKDLKLSRKYVRIFLPKEVYEDELSSLGGSRWGLGLLVYAIQGIPVLHGVEGSQLYYGYKSYGKNAYWRSRESFSLLESCSDEVKVVIIFNSLATNNDFEVHECSY